MVSSIGKELEKRKHAGLVVRYGHTRLNTQREDEIILHTHVATGKLIGLGCRREAPTISPMTTPLQPRLALIAAVARNGVIGRDGTLPWRLSADLKHFKALTTGKRIVMGRRTWESLPKQLPNREHVVVSSRALTLPADVTQVRTLTEALALPAPAEQPVLVIGGYAMYAEALALADDLFLTEIDADVPGDTHFPAWDRAQFREVSRDVQSGPLTANAAPVQYAFVHYERLR